MGQPLSELVTFCKHDEEVLLCLHQPATFRTKITHPSQWHRLFAEDTMLWGGGREWFHHYYILHYCAPLSVGDNSWKETGVFVSLVPSSEPTGTIVCKICEFCVEEHWEDWDQAEAVGSFS